MPKKGKRTVESEKSAKQAGRELKKQTEEEREKPRKKASSKKEVDLESWIEKNIDEVVSRAGLDYLNLNKELWTEVLRDIIVDIYGSTSSYKSAEDIAKRLVRNSEKIFPALATRLAHLLENPSVDQLEFIVINIGDAVLELAPRVYSWVSKLGRSDLLGILKHKWGVAWSRFRTPVLPVACPKCGFNSLMPDLVCLVCGVSVQEKELKEFVNFGNKLAETLSSISCSELGDLLKYDYILINDLEIKSPSTSRLPVDIEVYLSKSEKELVKREYQSRCLNEATK